MIHVHVHCIHCVHYMYIASLLVIVHTYITKSKTYCVSIDSVPPVRSIPRHIDVGLIDNSGPDLLRGPQGICTCGQEQQRLSRSMYMYYSTVNVQILYLHQNLTHDST